jgi:hypothetical protein
MNFPTDIDRTRPTQTYFFEVITMSFQFNRRTWLASCAGIGLTLGAAMVQAVTEAAPVAAQVAALPHAAGEVAAVAAKPTASADPAPKWISESFGVEVQGARLSASGYVIDLRYKVLDAEKAKPLMDRKVRPVLVDEVTGNRFYVPQPPVVGALRQTARSNPVVPGKAYFIIFANPDQRLKAGDSVTLYLGDQRFGNLRIEP